MTSDDNLDLSPWQPPSPPPATALADAVVARVREPATAAMYERATRTRGTWLLPALIGAGVGAVIAGATVFALFHTTAPAGDAFAKADDIKALEDRVHALEHSAVGGPTAPNPQPAPPAPADHPVLARLEHEVIDRQVTPVLDGCIHSSTATAEGEVFITVTVDAAGVPTTTVGPEGGSEYHDCIVRGANALRFGATSNGGSSTYKVHLTPTDPFAQPRDQPRSDCDADALEVDADHELALGHPAVAAQRFDEAIRCRPTNTRLRERRVLAACASQDAEGAQERYVHLSEASRQAVRDVCASDGIVFHLGTGNVLLQSRPIARILIDGKDIQQETPLKLSLPAGRHKVTFVIDQDKYTFTTTVEDGKTTRVVKDFTQ